MAESAAMLHDVRDVERVFEACFFASFRTRLEGGASEPLYLPSPAPAVRPHRILYREDFFASALHEVAHWCVAGARRRRLEDYGYWYEPEGRSAARQAAFESVESRPQAIEWAFAEACGRDFHPSADNLPAPLPALLPVPLAAQREPDDGFLERIAAWRQRDREHGLPPRAEIFRRALESLSEARRSAKESPPPRPPGSISS
ncbi:MAG TPA: elongation factor P hydroxylase [Myxococcota bacterium]|nr:elongation factor P hydroxylase [Myxococcota bacterium]